MDRATVIYPTHALTAAQIVSEKLTRSEAAVLHAVRERRAVHARELSDVKSVLRLIDARLLVCRHSKIGQVLTLSPKGHIMIGRSEYKETSPGVAVNIVFQRMAVARAAEVGYALVEVKTPTLALVSGDGRIYCGLLSNAARGVITYESVRFHYKNHHLSQYYDPPLYAYNSEDIKHLRAGQRQHRIVSVDVERYLTSHVLDLDG